MGRKAFQEFAHVLCHRFVHAPSNRDLVNLAILGDGALVLDMSEKRATHNGSAIEPLPYAEEWQRWADARLNELAIPHADLVRAQLTVDYRVELRRKAGLGWLGGAFDLRCMAVVAAVDREYRADVTAARQWGFTQV